ncbi:MAG: hypothetical protein HXS40_07765 [Theionarchaea archaeon]|jgi:hypothetical protein|nr:hypothetical protein [Theionarchaea archaeon]
MSLKRKWPKREKENPRNEPDLFSQLKGEIKAVRGQGEPPQKNPLTFSQYLCDLCSTSHPISALKQCAVCGRWACPNCWTDTYYVCDSCGGIIALKSIKL